jgi:hypothetical protein
MKKLAFLFFLSIIICSFSSVNTLKGTWEFRGGIYKGKTEDAPKGYSLQRKYSDTQYDAYLQEKGEKAIKYESGRYTLKDDTCLETQTYCSQPSKLIGITIHYLYTIRHDTLILQAKMPNGNLEEDYWKRVK